MCVVVVNRVVYLTLVVNSSLKRMDLSFREEISATAFQTLFKNS